MLKRFMFMTFRKFGFEIERIGNFGVERNGEFLEIYKKTKSFSTHSIQRLYALYKSVVYIVENDIPGDFVECGVFRGGSAMLCALTLLALGDTKRKLYLYDTYEGMDEPTEKDKTFFGMDAVNIWKRRVLGKGKEWNYCPVEEVKKNLFTTGYPQERLIFIKGKVQDTIPKNIPDKIALLHLDTDWYESTNHELIHLYPLLTKLGVLIIDDYGTWLGQREAVDNYIAEKGLKILLNRVDTFGCVGVKAN